MEIRMKSLSARGVVPQRATEHAAGIDLVATSKTYTNSYIEYGTSIAVEIPHGYVGLLCARSSISETGLMLANGVGVIDSDYRGELKFRFKRIENKDNDYVIGDRVGQLVITPVVTIDVVEADQLSSTDRGEGGFGSTGK